jgi:hypothetical protein
VKRSLTGRIGAVVAGVLLLSPLAACTPTPAPPKITAAFGKLTFPAPEPGAAIGDSPGFTYKASGVPRGGSIFLQKASISGSAVKWSNVMQLNVSPLAAATIIRPPFGRNTYRVGIFDAHGKGLTSALLPLDVYEFFTFNELTARPIELLVYAPNKNFPYVFQDAISFDDTSCRNLGPLNVFNDSDVPRRFEFSQTVAGKAKSVIFPIGQNPHRSGHNVLFAAGQPLTLGENFDLQILDNAADGSNVFGGNGSADCLTDTGSF